MKVDRGDPMFKAATDAESIVLGLVVPLADAIRIRDEAHDAGYQVGYGGASTRAEAPPYFAVVRLLRKLSAAGFIPNTDSWNDWVSGSPIELTEDELAVLRLIWKGEL